MKLSNTRLKRGKIQLKTKRMLGVSQKYNKRVNATVGKTVHVMVVGCVEAGPIESDGKAAAGPLVYEEWTSQTGG